MDLTVAYQKCLDCLSSSLEQLGVFAERSDLEAISDLIIQTMSGQWRHFHTPSHIFEVGGSGDPIEVLSALFHDLVYVQVDGGINLNISRYISSHICEANGQLAIFEEEDCQHERPFEFVCCIFGFAYGQKLDPFRGQNEFLSAVIAVKVMQSFLSWARLAEITACIEATIPFRGASQTGHTASDELHDNLVRANREFDLGMSEAEIVGAVKRAVRLANRDVENFALENPAEFLDNTWNLLPETNHDLIGANSYTVRGYRRSIQKMEGFINFLKPEVVFSQYENEPDDARYQALLTNTRRNLETARLYLGVKLITIAILEALSYRLGRNVHISTMMGEFPEPGVTTPALENFLPDISGFAAKPRTELEATVLELLSKGRTQESAYDLKNSPIATFIVQAIGFDSLSDLLISSKSFLGGNIGSEEFLCHEALKIDEVDVVGLITQAEIQLSNQRAGVFKLARAV
ncbi:MAG: hypothetical protein ACFB9N_02230 [Geitlerinemataceae cyanobacterium]